MPNPFSVLNPANPMRGYDFNALREMMNSMRNGNPMQMLSRMAMQNPRVQPIVQALQGGANPQQLFNSLCQQRGINPHEFMRNLTGNNGF